MHALYSLGNDSFEETHAKACRLGTWKNDTDLCPECTRSFAQRVPPLIFEWQKGPTSIGDFTWPGFLEDIVISERVRKVLDKKFKGFSMKPIEIAFDKGIRSKKMLDLLKKELKEKGPLWDMWVDSWCHIDVKASDIELERVCGTCSTKYYRPPKKGTDIIISGKQCKTDVFKTFEYPAWNFATQRIADSIRENGFTNVELVRCGSIV